MFLVALKQLFQKKQRESSLIHGFDEALTWIRTYEKAADYRQAIMAIRELMLKHKTAIHYYEEWVRKLTVLEASNVKEVSESAKTKIEKINSFIETLYYRVTALERRLKNIEKLKLKEEEDKKTEIQKAQLKHQMDEVNALLAKKEYTKALWMAKKIVFDNQHDRAALNLLTKIQKLYDSHKRSIEQDEKKKEKVNKTLAEIGVVEKTVEEDKKPGIFDPIFEHFREMKRKSLERKEYVRRQGTLQSIEKMLLRSGSIDNIVDGELRDDELFSIINSGLTKDVNDFDMYGFDFFGRIMGKDKIIGDTFGYFKSDEHKTIFYLGDATWHGIQAWFTVAVLSKLFFDLSKRTKNFAELFMQLNNGLKERIKWKSFITAIFFEWDAKKNVLRFIGAGHDPLYHYHRDTGDLEKIIPGGLALWVRMINNPGSIKVREISLHNEDVLVGYTDGLIEARNPASAMFTLEGLQNALRKTCPNFSNPQKVYDHVFKEVTAFQEGRVFDDDMSMFVFTRNTNKDLIENEQELKQLLQESNLKKFALDFNTKNRTRQDVVDKIRQQKYERDVKIRLDRLDRLYRIGEYIRLKQEVILYYREGFVHDKMKFYLEKSIENEFFTTIKKQEDKLKRKYATLMDLYKKGEYEIVIKESLDVIFKNGKI